jgi:tetratricopeptide (TPR) repeat protein
MRTINKHPLYILAIMLLFSTACKKDLQPYDSKSNENALATPDDLQTATYGTYAGLVNSDYTRFEHILSEYPSDNVALSGTTTDPLYNIYNYTDFPGNNVATSFWRQAYKTIFSANQIIEKITDGTSPELDQLKGENMYLRTMAHFDLVRFFGRPYAQDNGASPGIPIINATGGDLTAGRNTVKEVYDFMVADLLKASTLMGSTKDSRFASKEVANALLARLYLYMGDNAKAIEYANLVLNSNRYSLLGTEAYKTYFRADPENNPETIFAIRHTQADNRFEDAIGSMYYNDPVTQSTGWGEMYASKAYVALLDTYPADVRHSFIELQLTPTGDTLKRGNVPKYFINKYNWQEGIANLSSPVFLRLAEMYLIRAEANAKLGNIQPALEDVNLIRQRAGLSGAQLYTAGDLKGKASVLDVVLEERHLEFAFEGQRAGDLYRNNRPMIRAYPGFHSTDRFNQTINANDPRVVFFIPDREINLNPNLTQNP